MVAPYEFVVRVALRNAYEANGEERSRKLLLCKAAFAILFL
jgi:hypothetical protein